MSTQQPSNNISDMVVVDTKSLTSLFPFLLSLTNSTAMILFGKHFLILFFCDSMCSSSVRAKSQRSHLFWVCLTIISIIFIHLVAMFFRISSAPCQTAFFITFIISSASFCLRCLFSHTIKYYESNCLHKVAPKLFKTVQVDSL